MNVKNYFTKTGRLFRMRLSNLLPGAVDKIEEYAEHFEKAFFKGQTAAAALFSPGR